MDDRDVISSIEKIGGFRFLKVEKTDYTNNEAQFVLDESTGFVTEIRLPNNSVYTCP